MVSNISQIVYQLFQKETLEEVSESELRYFVKQYPFSGTGHLLLAKKLQIAGEKRALERETAVAALYFSNPAWLQYVLSGDTHKNISQSNPPFFVEHTDSGDTNLLIPEYNEEPVHQHPADKREQLRTADQRESQHPADKRENQHTSDQHVAFASGSSYPEPIVVPGLEISNQPAEHFPVEAKSEDAGSKTTVQTNPDKSVHSTEAFASNTSDDGSDDRLKSDERFQQNSIDQKRHSETETAFAPMGPIDGRDVREPQELNKTEITIENEALSDNDDSDKIGSLTGDDSLNESVVSNVTDSSNESVISNEKNSYTGAEYLNEVDSSVETDPSIKPDASIENVSRIETNALIETNASIETESSKKTDDSIPTEAAIDQTDASNKTEFENYAGSAVDETSKKEFSESEKPVISDQANSDIDSINPEASANDASRSSALDNATAETHDSDPSHQIVDGSGSDQVSEAKQASTDTQSSTETKSSAESHPSTETQPPALSLKPADSIDAVPKLEFDPYHTIDYFASQGIKLRLEDYSRDKLGQQLKSFTEWIRSMKRLPQQQSENSLNDTDQHSIRKIAEHSVEEKEVLTESMAEVWAKQGNYEKARQIYRKLSLQNPSKSTYFAAKIEQLKVL